MQKKMKKKVKNSPFKEKVAMYTPQKECPYDDRSKTIEDKCPQPKKKADNESSDEEEMGGGGCPMMGTSKSKRSPGLWIPKKINSVPYVSPFYEFLK